MPHTLLKTIITGCIQAALSIKDRVVSFRDGLPSIKRNWGALHEVGHEFLPWHNELLYCCPLLLLPYSILSELEAEADIFAADAFFFGSKFIELVKEGGFGIATAKELADNIFKTSYHSAFIRLVEESDTPCCLLVWRLDSEQDELRLPSNPVLHYYVKSPKFHGHFYPKQTTDNETICSLFENPSLGIVQHVVNFNLKKEEALTSEAESFCNVYNVFTLINQPKRN